MKNQNKIINLASISILTSVFANISYAETWDMPTAYSADNYHTEIAVSFSENVEEKTNGRLEIIVHPSGSLFKGDEIFRSVRRGLVPIGDRLISTLGNEDPIYEIDSIPFLATTFDESYDLYMTSKPKLEETLDEQGLKLLYSIPWPPQGLFAKSPVESASDMEGVKFRAYNTTTAQVAEKMGAVPTKIEASDLSQAFATGTVESMLSSGSTGYDRKLWEYIDYWYDVKAWLPRNFVIVNKRSWASLSDEDKQAVIEAAESAEQQGWEEARELADWYKEQLASHGMEIKQPSEQLSSDFSKVGEEMSQEWVKKAGEKGKEILKEFRSTN